MTRSASMTVTATPTCAREWRSRLGELAIPALTVRLAQASDDAVTPLTTLTGLAEGSIARGQPVRIADLAVNGNDLIAAGFQPGKGLQAVLQALLETVWAFPEKNTRDELIKEALKRKD